MTTRNSFKSPGFASPALLSLALLAAACATPSGTEKDLKQGDIDKITAVGSKVSGLVVWTSAREGVPHLYTMKTDATDLKQLTKGERTDWYPRFSPDGGKVLFSRSRTKGFVRQRQANEPGTWDIYTINVDGSDLKKVVADGAWATWVTADEILFVRGTKVIRAKLDGGDETELVDTAEQPVLGGATVRQPQLSPDGKYLALTLADTHRQVGIWKIKKKHWTQVGAGAQGTWAPDGASLVWIDTTGKGLAHLSRIPIQKGVPAEDADKAATAILDLPGRRSREAFPRMSNDGKWIVFASAINALENDLEDFEIYVWEVGAPADEATRLTFNTGNDSWPDIYTGAPSPKAADEDAAEKAPADDSETKPKAATDEEAQGAEKPAAEPAAESEAATEEKASGAEDDAAPFKAKGKGKKPSPKAKKKHR